MNKTVKVPQVLHRAATLGFTGEGDSKKLTMSISSDTPYKRYDYWNDEEYYEILDHSPGGFDDSRLKAGLPILFNHNTGTPLANAKAFACDGHRIDLSDLVWCEDDFAQSKKRDAVNGALPFTSVGYQILDDGECIGAKDGIPVYKFKWSPSEGSVVPVPADTSVGTNRRRDHKPEGEPREISVRVDNVEEATRNIMPEPIVTPAPAEPTAPKIDVKEVAGNAVADFKKRCTKIDEFVGAIKNEAWRTAAEKVASKHKGGDADFEEFRTEALNHMQTAALETPQRNAEIGLNDKEKNKFSVMRAFRLLQGKQPLDGLEKEVSETAAKAAGLTHRNDALYLPPDITEYDMRDSGLTQRQFDNYLRTNQNVGSGPAGGFTVPTTLGSMIEYLRNSTVLGQAGITTLGGLQGDMSFPVQITGATAGWVGETGSQADSAATFSIKTVTPHRLSGTIPFTSQFLAQSGQPAEQFARNELMTVGAIAIDLAGLEGTGVSGQPLGVKNTANIGTDVTFSTAATWAKVVLFETSINTANANIGSIKFILSSAAVGKWKGILRASAAGAKFLIDDDMTANGYPVLRTNQVTGDIAYFGVWNQLMHFMWATQEYIVDPYALKKTGGIEVTANTFHDFLVRQPAAFEVSTDSAAQ